MIWRALLSFLIVASLSAADAPGPFHARVGALSTFDDWRAYSGGASRGVGVEVGYALPTLESDAFGLRFHVGWMQSRGKARSVDPLPQAPDSTQTLPVYVASHDLTGVRAGVDLVFSSQGSPLQGYLGLGLHSWTGSRSVQSGRAEGHVLPGDRAPKLGLRVGLEYALSGDWAVAGDYSVSMWRSEVMTAATKPVKGINPMKPSWLTLAVQHRF